jgi:hypothetical protein
MMSGRPLSSTTSDTSSPTMQYLRNIMEIKKHNIRAFTPQEFLDLVNRLYERGKITNCLKLCK